MQHALVFTGQLHASCCSSVHLPFSPSVGLGQGASTHCSSVAGLRFGSHKSGTGSPVVFRRHAMARFLLPTLHVAEHCEG